MAGGGLEKTKAVNGKLQLTVFVDAPVRKQLKNYSIKTGISLRRIVQSALVEYFKKVSETKNII